MEKSTKSSSVSSNLLSLDTKKISQLENTVSDETVETKNSAPAVFSIEQLNIFIKKTIESFVGVIWVKGEISNFKAHSSGHYYFSLKDEKSQISAVMFRGFNSRLKFKPMDGVEVLVRGRVSVYEPRGSYQIVCEQMEPVGAGALQRAFEELKFKLKSEGLFAPERKKPIPSFPRHIAIVTSPTGAAIKDILNILERRGRGLQITIVPTLVQGAGAAEQILSAFEKAESLAPDVIIFGRGGGSMEDLWAFNDESLARRIAACKIPTISAVGHEIDFTIGDFVADLRAPTPSAAAELVAKSAEEVLSKLKALERSLFQLSLTRIEKCKNSLMRIMKNLVDPRHRLQVLIQKNDELLSRLTGAQTNIFAQYRHRIEICFHSLVSPHSVIKLHRSSLALMRSRMDNLISRAIETKKQSMFHFVDMLTGLNPLSILSRGYAVVTQNEKTVMTSRELNKGDEISIRFGEGQVAARVENIIN